MTSGGGRRIAGRRSTTPSSSTRRDPHPETVQCGRGRAHPLHGTRAGGAGEGGSGKAPDGYLVAHDRKSPTGRGEAGLSRRKSRLGVLKRIVGASSPPGGLVVDLVAGSGTTGAAALALGRRFVLADHSEEAFAVMRSRFAGEAGVDFRGGRTRRGRLPSAPTSPRTVIGMFSRSYGRHRCDDPQVTQTNNAELRRARSHRRHFGGRVPYRTCSLGR